MGHIYVSYSRPDTEVVDRIVAAMEQAGLSVWLDRQVIKADKTWRAQIVEAIDTCDAFVLVLSSNSAASNNVRREIDLAQDSGRKIFIIRSDSVDLPAHLHYQLAGLQQIHIQSLGFDEAVGELIESLKQQKPTTEEPNRQVEVVIRGVDRSKFGPEKQQELLDFIAKLTGASSSEILAGDSTTDAPPPPPKQGKGSEVAA